MHTYMDICYVNTAERSRRVLALHGFAQTGAAFRQKTGSMRKQMKGVEFVYIDAPCLGTHTHTHTQNTHTHTHAYTHARAHIHSHTHAHIGD
jgi:hypothetical protein